MLETGSIIVVDIGKTLSKVTLWSKSGQMLDRRVRPNEARLEGGIRRLDAAGIRYEYLDGATRNRQAVVERLFGSGIATSEIGQYRKDAKTELQEWLQARKLALPHYVVMATTGAAHRQTFEVACEVRELRQSQRGMGPSRRAAEQAAAAALLEILKASHA